MGLGSKVGVKGCQEGAIAVVPKVMCHQADITYLVLFNLYNSFTDVAITISCFTDEKTKA